jgi:hypothetical protein
MLGAHQFDVDAPEEASKAGSAYFSKKDVRTILIVIAAVTAIAIPLYYAFMQQRDKQVCATNMHAIYNAMMQYAEQNDQRLPPLYEVGGNGAPLVMHGKPSVWASQLVPYMNTRATFFCPAAEEDEKMPALGYDGRSRKDIDLTYGMYLPMGTFPYLLATSQSDTAVLVETSNHGSQGSFNPLPFRNAEGTEVPFDAFMAGFDDSNEALTPESKSITRLAFRNVAQGYGSKDVVMRHGAGLHVFYLDGHKGFLKPANANIKNIFPDVEKPWRTR